MPAASLRGTFSPPVEAGAQSGNSPSQQAARENRKRELAALRRTPHTAHPTKQALLGILFSILIHPLPFIIISQTPVYGRLILFLFVASGGSVSGALNGQHDNSLPSSSSSAPPPQTQTRIPLSTTAGTSITSSGDLDDYSGAMSGSVSPPNAGDHASPWQQLDEALLAELNELMGNPFGQPFGPPLGQPLGPPSAALQDWLSMVNSQNFSAWNALGIGNVPIVAAHDPSVDFSGIESSPVSLHNPPPAFTISYGEFGGSDEYLEVLNKDRFLQLNDFYMNFLQRGSQIKIPIDGAPAVITRADLNGDACDWQGIDWHMRRLKRSYVRAARAEFQTSLMPPALREVRKHMQQIPNSESFFSFRRMDTMHRAWIPHFQLRNLLGVSNTDIYYAARDKVLYTDSEGSPPKVAMDLSKSSTEAGKFLITTLAVSSDVVIAGGFEGEYALNNAHSNRPKDTVISRINNTTRNSKSHITNHIGLFPSRTTYSPQAVLSSNDNRLRVLDCTTNTFTYTFTYPQAVNCSATSPNGRMRVIVGDFRETLVTDAETGRAFQALRTHVDDAFACDWADDGIHVATAAQDSSIVVWDARNWARPLKVLYSELSVPRTLRFSPVGGGRRVLVVGEADDCVSVVDAAGFERKQVLDFFGRTAGIGMSGDGQGLWVGVVEGSVGGLMGFERCAGGWGGRGGRGERRDGEGDDGSEGSDWESEERMDGDEQVLCGRAERRRRQYKKEGKRVRECSRSYRRRDNQERGHVYRFTTLNVNGDGDGDDVDEMHMDEGDYRDKQTMPLLDS
ncbi:uncharacterized protein EI97DRAFT_438673 [Westerdykella ornata]|uniref:Uncharacterized protein n=1 Tax=Westerdykella ornata TaxID=318751 RepID=A0A6A6JYY4_WESOR|nr:uncharacterized protein EI97DRAFT_438673 [Westerdykella ornata]KAF2281303.1 hypothetical protein EI97DRAFT_438673 [Westerdykella ornata]